MDSTSTQPHVTVSNLDKRFLTSEAGLFRRKWRVSANVIRGMNLQIHSLQFVSIVGPSGCGKTTFLNLLAGLTDATDGEIVVAGERLTKPRKRTAVVFQEPGLFPWHTVADNVLLGLHLNHHRRPTKQDRELARRYLELVGLEAAAGLYPWQLSGGMKQRVGIARALATEPDLLLMDEPFGALDAQTRLALQNELLRICGEYRATVVFITHDVDEAVLLSDRILVMDRGRIIADLTCTVGAENRAAGEIQRGAKFAELRDQVLSELGLHFVKDRK